MKNAIIKGCICAIVISVLLTLWIVSQWVVHLPYYIDYLVPVLLASIVFFFLKNNSLNHYGIACSVFIPMLILMEIILAAMNIYHIAFRLIFGMDEVMGAGDGFMIISSYIELIIIVILGIVSSFVWTLIKSRKAANHK